MGSERGQKVTQSVVCLINWFLEALAAKVISWTVMVSKAMR